MSNHLEVHQVSKSYREHHALSNVSLKVPRQSIYGLLGPNGAGKTTLIRIINQIIGADKGEIFISGEALSPDHIRVIGYLPEERGLYKKMKVGEQLVYLGRLRGLARKEAKRRAVEWCKKLQIFDWWHKKIEDLSKGMAQKIQFIATVMHEPEIIILDEPFSGFDPVNAEIIKDEILALRERGSTVIFSTHRMESVEQLCDHIALINQAEKILEGSKREIKENHRNGTYELTHTGVLRDTKQFRILDAYDTIDRKTSTIQSVTQGSSNELLKAVIEQVEVYSFVEKVPSINDIFISKVKGGDHA